LLIHGVRGGDTDSSPNDGFVAAGFSLRRTGETLVPPFLDGFAEDIPVLLSRATPAIPKI
jgi:hypothetical protein